MKKNNFTVKYKQEGKSLSDVISEKLIISKKQTKLWIDAKLVLVNKKRIWMRNHIVKEGDLIEILNTTNSTKKPKKVSIIWKDDHYLIVNKPAGILSNASNESLENILKNQENNPKICAVHRLDKETSGCLIYATSPNAKKKAIPLFKQKKIIKIYRTLTIGKFPNSWKEIRTDIDGYMATTLIKILDNNKNASYLEVQIETGRTHQIRKHLASKRYPVLGDKKYAGTKNEISLIQPRHMLHAYRLIFTHPFTNKKINIVSPIPNDFKNNLRKLKLN